MPEQELTESETFEAMFGPIRARFRQSMVAHVEAMERATDQGEGLRTPGALEAVAARAHKISGVAATLGYVEIGRSATAVETSIVALERSTTFTVSDLERLYPLVWDLVDRMQAEI